MDFLEGFVIRERNIEHVPEDLDNLLDTIFSAELAPRRMSLKEQEHTLDGHITKTGNGNNWRIAMRPKMITQIIRRRFFCVTDVYGIGK